MIRCPTFPEPLDFGQKVRTPGKAFLALIPTPNNAQWKTKELWQLFHDDLYALYGGICAYCASWTARKRGSRLTNHTSIDHFLPKSICPQLAYEWSNFRLCRSQINQRKDDSLDVMDPLGIQNGWFELDFFTFLVRPNAASTRIVRNRVRLSIDKLGLNDEGYIKERVGVLKQYCVYGIPLSKIQGKYPFIAHEIRRTDFDTMIKPAFMRAFTRSGRF